MTLCKICGAEIKEGEELCPKCAKMQQDLQNQPQKAEPAAAPKIEFDPKDIEDNKVMGALGYILFLIPLLAAKESPYARYHANQGLVLLIGYVASSLLWVIPILGWIAAPICYIGVSVLSIWGFVNAITGKAKDLPLVGKFKLIK